MKTLSIILAVLLGLAAVQATPLYGGMYDDDYGYGGLYGSMYGGGYGSMYGGMYRRFGYGRMYGMQPYGMYGGIGYPYRRFGMMGAYPYGGYGAMYSPFNHGKYPFGKKGVTMLTCNEAKRLKNIVGVCKSQMLH